MFYITKKILSTIKRVKSTKKKKFLVIAFNSDYMTFIVYLATFNISSDFDVEVYTLKKAQIIYSKVDKTFINIIL